jgi:hypothetical protein
VHVQSIGPASPGARPLQLKVSVSHTYLLLFVHKVFCLLPEGLVAAEASVHYHMFCITPIDCYFHRVTNSFERSRFATASGLKESF